MTKAKRLEVREDHLIEFIETAFLRAHAGCPLDDTSGCKRKRCEGCKYYWNARSDKCVPMPTEEIIKWMIEGAYK